MADNSTCLAYCGLITNEFLSNLAKDFEQD